jgi:hypothetical protein
MFKQWKTWLYAGLSLPSIFVLALHGYNGAYTRLISDDYCSLYFGQRLGFLKDIWYWYTTSQGRYSLFAMDTVLVWIGTGSIGAVTTLTLIIWSSAIIGVLFGVQPKTRELKFKLRDSVCFGNVLLFVMLLLTPNIPQSLYWWNGLATHTLPLIGFTIYLAIYQWGRVQKADKRNVGIAAIVGLFLAIINGGFSEAFTAAQIALLVLWLTWLFLRKEMDIRQPGPAYLAGGLVGALVALIIAFVSPGNAVRQSLFPANHGILDILQISFSGYLALLKDIFTTPEKLMGLAGAFIGFVWLGKQIQPERISKGWEPLAIFITCFFLLTYACYTPAAFGMSDAPPERSLIIPVFFLILGTASAGFLWGNQHTRYSLPASGIARENLGLLAIAVVLIMVSAGMNGKHLYDSSTVYIKYAQAWDQNEQKILDAAKSGQQTVIIHSVRNWAGLNDPGDNPKFFVNYCMSKYYNINILADNTGMQSTEP